MYIYKYVYINMR